MDEKACSIIQSVKDELMIINKEYSEKASDRFDFWEQHVKLVVKEALYLADEYNADKEIVELGSLLHDIALMSNVGTRVEHEINGKIIAEKILTKYKYPTDRKERVLGCVLHHRSSGNAVNIEELCVADADILAHYDNIPMCFATAYKYHSEITSNDELKKYFEYDYNDLSERTKRIFKARFNNIMDVLFGKLL